MNPDLTPSISEYFGNGMNPDLTPSIYGLELYNLQMNYCHL